MLKYYQLLVLNIPLFAEVIRKYVVWNDLVFLAGDVIALATFLSLLFASRIRGQLPPAFYWLLPLFLTWVLVLHALSGHSLAILGVGLRATFLPLVYLFLSASFIARYPDAIRLLMIAATLWVLAAGGMGLAQINLGPNHPINAVWGEQMLGMGDYVGKNREIGVEGLFRPTSLFTHTGKFGQVVFTLVLFRWCVHAFSNVTIPKWTYVFLAADVITIAVSGQRAAFLFLIIALIGIAYFARRRLRGGLARWFYAMAGLCTALLSLTIILPRYGDALLSRFVSALNDIPVRIMGNFVLPLGSVLDTNLFAGEGLGYFTFGSRLFGGQIAYLTLKLEGLGESSLIRLCGEIGFVGVLLMGSLFAVLLVHAFRLARSASATDSVASAIFYVLWVTGLLLWSNTADVFGNTVAVSAGYALAGAVLLPLRTLALRARNGVPHEAPYTPRYSVLVDNRGHASLAGSGSRTVATSAL